LKKTKSLELGSV